ncbi:hypothetical protein [Streptosporangium sp. NPDC049644]|uniref:hypothetical protein n=1 Tax=Streptosporangium sp. NPDC049644 TaxID=3155507 RepID=UPI00343BE30C
MDRCSILANKHIIPGLGARKLVDLTADDVDRWLADKAKELSTRTLRELRSILVRAISRTQARDKVKRNVALLCEIPEERRDVRPGLTLDQAEAVLKASEGTAAACLPRALAAARSSYGGTAGAHLVTHRP